MTHTNTTQTNSNHETHRLDDIKHTVKDLVGRGKDTAVAAKDKAVDLQQRATTLIKGHPIAAVGIAFGVGYFLMRLVRR